jgi:hypothetical protein
MSGGNGNGDNGNEYHFYNGIPPHQAHSETSRDAAIAAMSGAATDRMRILEFIKSRGAEGATSDECQAHFGLAHQTGSARVAELLQIGHIIESGRRRKTRRNRDADVLVIAPPGTPPRNINKRRVIPEGFVEDELPLLYVRFRELCEQALASQKKGAELHPLIVRLGFWLRENAGPIADDMDAKRKYRKK